MRNRGSVIIGKVLQDGNLYFYSAEITSGVFGSGKGDEYTNPKKENGSYEPIWIDIERLEDLNIYPREIAEKILRKFRRQ
ncbi:hypothetical protein E4665_11035 [Sporolactobacillus shoreae]|uniref:Uncharacterized protein n=1 Tax=Sporolactobacillus shoreae TaxID=1465501 RepID=A0A4Z0GNT7_9BACL|nr:hypothetical protein [Sporolactobacillus shoreae]TGA97638.1 hypothetical protein E4665_11035 [Sporolactobacillus shoreae]